MKVRPLLYVTALLAAILGAAVVYIVLSVPNDIRADALLRDARQSIKDGNNDHARDALLKVVQQYPRTDAAAAAMVALDSLAQKERDDLAKAIMALRTQNEQQGLLIADLQKAIAAPAPKTVTVEAPAPKPPAVKKTTTPPAKKKKTTTRRRRR
jgi:hypothetical protein